jgi:rRNA maturation endonuclease Nob1
MGNYADYDGMQRGGKEMKQKKEVYLECVSCKRGYPLHETNKEGKQVIKQTCDECGGGLQRRRVRK